MVSPGMSPVSLPMTPALNPCSDFWASSLSFDLGAAFDGGVGSAVLSPMTGPRAPPELDAPAPVCGAYLAPAATAGVQREEKESVKCGMTLPPSSSATGLGSPQEFSVPRGPDGTKGFTRVRRPR